MPTQFNRSLIKLQHQVWRNKLLTFLNGGQLQVAVNHKDCAIGKWLYKEGGLNEYGSLAEMIDFEKQHAEYHDAIKKVIDLQLAGNTEDAWTTYQSIKSLSDELMETIDALSDKIGSNEAIGVVTNATTRTKVA
ncbi:hypothetical protein TI03_00400 [Achromatium sp. WMS1]|nr:hypothetical protein TI03_00400 [Achromatium sp. WMS1]